MTNSTVIGFNPSRELTRVKIYTNWGLPQRSLDIPKALALEEPSLNKIWVDSKTINLVWRI